MSIVTVNLVDTFDEWRIKTNSLGTETGDLTGLSTTDTSSIVAAINEVDANADLGLKNIVEDITPELGGNLNIGSNDIFGTGTITLTGASSIITAARFSGAIELSDDSQPELAANLNLMGFDITGTGNINITGSITATTFSGDLGADLGLNSNDITGTGNINITGSLTATSIAGTVTGTTQSAGDNSTKLATTAYVDLQVATENTITEMDDTTITSLANNDLLQWNSVTSVWENRTLALSGLLTDVVGDITPQLGGDLDLNSQNITGTGNINITGSLTATSIAGTVTGVTQSAGDNSTKLATTAYANTAATAAAAGAGSGLVFAIALG